MVESIVQKPNIYKRALELCWLSIVFLIPLFFNPISHQAYYFNKALLLQFLVFVMLGLKIADWIYSRHNRYGFGWKSTINSPLKLAILAFGLLAALSTALSITPEISFWGSWERMEGLITTLCWITFFLIVTDNLRTRKQLNRAIYTLLASSALVAVFGILQYYLWDVMQNFFRAPFYNRVYSTTGNALSLSAYIAMVIPFTLVFIIRHWQARRKGRNTSIFFILCLLLVFQFWCLALAQYSITILLFMVSGIAFVTFSGIIKKNKWILGFGITGILMLVGIAALIVIPLILPSAATESKDVEDTVSIVTPEKLGLLTIREDRVQYWYSAIEIVLTTPEIPFSNDYINPLRTFVGYGPETFIITSQSVFPDTVKSRFTSVSMLLDRPHNHYLYLATTVGLLGLAAFLSLLVIFYYGSWKQIRGATLDIDKLILIALMAGMLQYVTDSLFNPSTLSAELVFWLMLALLPVMGRLVIVNKQAQLEMGEKPRLDKEIIRTPHKMRAYMSILCVAILLGIGITITIRPFMADIHLQKALGLQAEMRADAVWSFSKVTDIYPRQAAYWGNLAGYTYLVAINAENGDAQTTILTYSTESYEKARQLEPYLAYRYYTLADAYVYWANQGAKDKWALAFSLYDQSLQLFPDNAVILNKYALAYTLKGDYDAARVKISEAALLDSDWAETYFLQALLSTQQGMNEEAALELIAPLDDDSINLEYFRRFCSNLAIFDMVQPLEDALEGYLQMAGEEWIPHAMLGVTSFYNRDGVKSLNEFDTAMALVPNEDTRTLFTNILYLSKLSDGYKAQLINIAPSWERKLSQSPDSESLLHQLDVLIYNQD